MTDSAKEKAATIYTVVESVVLAMSVVLMTWLANVVVQHGNILAGQTTQINVNSSRLDKIELHGSALLTAHSGLDDNRDDTTRSRLEKIEIAILVLQSAPGELKAIGVRLDGFADGIRRIEKTLEEHTKGTK